MLKAKKLKTAQTVINKSTEINQAWLDAYPGPYSVQGGSEANVIEITFLGPDDKQKHALHDYIQVKKDTYFIIETDYVNINGNDNTLYFKDISHYEGLVQNHKSSHIYVKNIIIKGENSSLLEKSGWVLGSDYGLGDNIVENKVEGCKNFLPISYKSGGIIGCCAKIHALNCENYGKFLSDNRLYGLSGGIAGK